MTQEEKIDKILTTVLPLARMVEEHHTTLYGNGQPGHSKDITLLKQRQEDCPARKAATTEGKRLNLACIALVVAVVSCVASAVFGVVGLWVK